METNQKPWKPWNHLEKPWKPTKNHEKPWNYLEKPWKPTKNHEKPWNYLEKPWKTMKLPWKTMETTGHNFIKCPIGSDWYNYRNIVYDWPWLCGQLRNRIKEEWLITDSFCTARKAQDEDAKQETKIRTNERELQSLKEANKKLTVEMERLQKKVRVYICT